MSTTFATIDAPGLTFTCHAYCYTSDDRNAELCTCDLFALDKHFCRKVMKQLLRSQLTYSIARVHLRKLTPVDGRHLTDRHSGPTADIKYLH